MEFSLFYFAGDVGQTDERDRYRLLVEGARFADAAGFSAVWTPERHFHPFGGIYPNPAVTSAALAQLTTHVRIRAGSVVLPLNDPIRVAEDWAMIDNLSGGRVGVSFASGWHATDFVLQPANFLERKRIMVEGIATVMALWRGETITRTDGTGVARDVRIFPPPLQPELPIWITSAGDVDTFRLAGRLRANILTHLLGQELVDLRYKISEYRRALASAATNNSGYVTLMLHAFVGSDDNEVRERVRQPLSDYLRSSWDLMLRHSEPGVAQIDPDSLSSEDVDFLVTRAFDRYFETSGLLGTPEKCLALVERLTELGVDECACLIDFGLDANAVLESLEYLYRLKTNANRY